MKKHFKKYIPIIICTSIAFFAACRHEKETTKQNTEDTIIEEIGDSKDIPSIRR